VRTNNGQTEVLVNPAPVVDDDHDDGFRLASVALSQIRDRLRTNGMRCEDLKSVHIHWRTNGDVSATAHIRVQINTVVRAEQRIAEAYGIPVKDR
jgi:hypothetical protein